MPIEFACPCGQKYRVKDSYASRTIQCRACKADIEVPPADAVDLGIITGDSVSASTPSPIIPPVPSWPQSPSPIPLAHQPPPAMVYSSKPPSYPPRATAQRVVVIDFDMPFGSLVWILVKLSFAAIPAMIIVWMVSAGILLLLALFVSLVSGTRF